MIVGCCGFLSGASQSLTNFDFYASFNGVNNGTVFTDRGKNQLTITRVGTRIVTSTTDPNPTGSLILGGSSVKVDRIAADNYLKISVPSGFSFNSNFTIQFRFCTNSSVDNQFILCATGSTGEIIVVLSTIGGARTLRPMLQLREATGSNNVGNYYQFWDMTSGGPVIGGVQGGWHEWSVQRVGNRLYSIFDGLLTTTSNMSNSGGDVTSKVFYNPASLGTGEFRLFGNASSSSYNLDGNVDELILNTTALSNGGSYVLATSEY